MMCMSTQMHEHGDVPRDTFPMRLAIARFHAGNISAKEAALRVGVSGQAWRNWEAERSPGAHQPAMLAYIAQQLGVNEEWLRNGGPLSPIAPLESPQAGTETTRWYADVIPLFPATSPLDAPRKTA